MLHRSLSTGCLLLLGTAPVSAQAPPAPHDHDHDHAQVSLADLRPELLVVVDAVGDHLSADPGADGFDAAIRLIEFHAAADLDESARVHLVAASSELESPELEEAAIEYRRPGTGTTLTAGRFFLEFGDQMDLHLTDLRTVDRPRVLREFLGEELAGTGLRLEQRLELAGAPPITWSVGAYSTLVGEAHDHGGAAGPAPAPPERKDAGELSLAGRVAVEHAVGERGRLVAGASARVVPEFSFVDDVNAVRSDRLSNSVLGLDAVFERSGRGGSRRLSIGAELLAFDGDLSAETDTSGPAPVLNVVHDRVSGGYAFVDLGWNERDSGGVQLSWLESPEDPTIDERELDVYLTRALTARQRLRVGATSVDSDVAGDSTRVYVQLTASLGSHAH